MVAQGCNNTNIIPSNVKALTGHQLSMAWRAAGAPLTPTTRGRGSTEDDSPSGRRLTHANPASAPSRHANPLGNTTTTNTNLGAQQFRARAFEVIRALEKTISQGAHTLRIRV